MMVLIKLIFAHFIGDFLLQPPSWVKNKESKKAKSIYLYLHTLIHGLLIILVLWNINYWRLAILIMVAHGTIDTLKLYAQKEENKSNWFIIDQVLHFISLLVLWVFILNPESILNLKVLSSKIWIYTTAIFMLTTVSGIVMRELMSTWSRALGDSNDESLSNAGKYIGILERLFVFVFIITGYWEGIGFLLAAKSVFRFGDLKEAQDRKLTEYILIGTLLSFGIAIAVGMLVIKLIKQA
jgi:hypothetical protein